MTDFRKMQDFAHFQQHEREFRRTAKSMVLLWIGAVVTVFGVLFAFFCGLIFFVLWCLQHFGFIQ